jgi:acyl carrier protein
MTPTRPRLFDEKVRGLFATGGVGAINSPSNDAPLTTFEANLGSVLEPDWVYKIRGSTFVCASFFLAVASCGIHHVLQDNQDIPSPPTLRDIHFLEYLAYDQSTPRMLIVTFSFDGDAGDVSISSREGSSEHQHFRCQFTLTTHSALPSPHQIKADVEAVFEDIACRESFTPRTIWKVLMLRSFEYSTPMQCLGTVSSASDGSSSNLSSSALASSSMASRPAFAGAEGALQLAELMAIIYGESEGLYLCSSIKSVYIPSISSLASFDQLYCQRLTDADRSTFDIWAVQSTPTPQVIAQWQGVQVQRVEESAFLAHPSFDFETAPHPRGVFSPSAPPAPPVHTSPFAAADAQSSSLQETVLQLVASTCDIPLQSIRVDTGLDSIGFDSLMSMEVLGQLSELFPHANLTSQLLSTCHSVGDIVGLISTLEIPSTAMSTELSAPSSLSAPWTPETVDSSTFSSPQTVFSDDNLLEDQMQRPLVIVDSSDLDQHHSFSTLLMTSSIPPFDDGNPGLMPVLDIVPSRKSTPLALVGKCLSFVPSFP